MCGILFVISSPSGGGKGTLIRMAREQVSDLALSISWTTRPPRAGETEAQDYHFVSVEEFEAMRARGEFLEWASVHGNFYGTSRRTVEAELAAGRDIVLEIDVQGAMSVRRIGLAAVFVFIIPPSFEVLRARLTERHTESAESLRVRLRNARQEVAHYREFDYLILNADIKRAASELVAVICAERVRRARRERLAESILATFPDPSSII